MYLKARNIVIIILLTGCIETAPIVQEIETQPAVKLSPAQQREEDRHLGNFLSIINSGPQPRRPQTCSYTQTAFGVQQTCY